MAKKIPKIKADDFVEFEESEKPEKFTNFQELSKKVEILKENFDEIVEMLRENKIVRNKEIQAEYFDEDKLYKRLDEED